jgi:hypothetical protein
MFDESIKIGGSMFDESSVRICWLFKDMFDRFFYILIVVEIIF